MEQNFESFCTRFLELKSQTIPLVIVTMIGEKGHAPQDIGARMIVGVGGILFGTVGGGKIEKKCLDLAMGFLKQSGRVPHQSFHWNLKRDVGMSCGGEVSFFFEIHKPEADWKIALFGAGHIVQELAPLLLKLDCTLTVTDPREEWVNRLPNTSRLKKNIASDMGTVMDQLPDDTFVCMITMGHSTDYPLLERALKTRQFPYLGVLGSKVKRIKMESELREAGLDPEKAKQFLCPIGEDYGKNSPAEIAVSIAADLLKNRRDYFKSTESAHSP
jgi:xanthine dehydrogenase accessory factor